MNVRFGRAGFDRHAHTHAAEIADGAAIDLALLGQRGKTCIGRQHHITFGAFGDTLGDGAGGTEFEFHRVAALLFVRFDQFAHHRLHRAGAENHHFAGDRRCHNKESNHRSEQGLMHGITPF